MTCKRRYATPALTRFTPILPPPPACACSYLEMVHELEQQIAGQGFTDIAMVRPAGAGRGLLSVSPACRRAVLWLKSGLEQPLPSLLAAPQACGSGGTTAGIALGNHLAGLGLRVHAYGVCDDEACEEGFEGALRMLACCRLPYHAPPCLRIVAPVPYSKTNSLVWSRFLRLLRRAAGGHGRWQGRGRRRRGRHVQVCPRQAAQAAPLPEGAAAAVAPIAHSSACLCYPPTPRPAAPHCRRAVQAKGAGYAMSRDEELDTVASVALSTSVILDPV